MTSNHKLTLKSGQARHIAKEKKLLNLVQERGRRAKMVVQQARGKRRPKSDHEHASSQVMPFWFLRWMECPFGSSSEIMPFGLYHVCDALNLV